MNLDVLYLILGILTTLITFFLGIRYTAKQKNKVRLLFIQNDCESLFKSVVQDLNSLEIKFKGNPVNESLISYKITIFNSGNIDIDKNIIHEPVCIHLPNEFEWKGIKIIDRSENLNVNFKANSKLLKFNWDILKVNEYFTIDSIIEYKATENEKIDSRDALEYDEDIGDRLLSQIGISQRITNLKAVDREERPEKPTNIILAVFPALFILFLMFGGIYLSIGQKYLPQYHTTFEVIKDSTTNFIQVRAKGENEIEILDSIGNKLYTRNLQDLSPEYFTGKIENKKDKFRIGLFIFGITGSFLMALILIILTSWYISDWKLYKRLKVIEDKY